MNSVVFTTIKAALYPKKNDKKVEKESQMDKIIRREAELKAEEEINNKIMMEAYGAPLM